MDHEDVRLAADQRHRVEIYGVCGDCRRRELVVTTVKV